MKNVIILEPEEYDALIEVQNTHKELIEELDKRAENKDELQEFVKDWLY